MKLRKVSIIGANTTTTDYIGGIQYLDGGLDFIQHAEGRAVKSGSTYDYEYNLTDHLGNVRVTVDDAGSVVQRDDYYPFGLTFNSYSSGTKNNYLYNQGSKKTFRGEEGITFAVERQPELGVDFTKFRVYDPALGRFWQVDPFADQMDQESWTPYHYGFNNPIRWNDPEGKWPWPKALTDQANYITNKIEGALKATGDAVKSAGNYVAEKAEAAGEFLSSITPNVVVNENKDGEFFEPTSGPTLVIEKEDMEDIKTAVGATSKSMKPSLGPSEKRASSTSDKLNDVTNSSSSENPEVAPDTVYTGNGVRATDTEGTTRIYSEVVVGNDTFNILKRTIESNR